MFLEAAYIVPHPPIILPEVGRGEEMKIQKTTNAYIEVAKRISQIEPDTIIITSPHTTMYSDYFHISPGTQAKGDMRHFGVNKMSIEVEYDHELVKALSDETFKEDIPAGTLGERDASLDHGTFIPLYFINKYYRDYKVVRIGLSGLSNLEHYRLGKVITRTVNELGRKVVFIASGDLSHKLLHEGPYGFTKEGPEFDKQVTEAMTNADFLAFLNFDPSFCEAAAECGLKSFIIMAGALDGKAVDSKLLSYEGTFGVGYAVAAFDIKGNDENRQFDIIFKKEQQKKIDKLKLNESPYVKLARLSLETYVRKGEYAPIPDDLPDDMTRRKAGVFVSLKKHGQLRGCIGTISPVTNSVAMEILRNAVSAGTEDPRFAPVNKAELDEIVYSVDVLSEPEDISSIEELDVKKYGVIVSSGFRRGLLLPNLDGVDTPEQQVSIALEKAGIRPKEQYKLQRFEVVRHK
ncbi:MAG: AmmeMemoRadiSam system protein A [Clostridiaceae bacterium]|jgi:AmmeMemoRadiSam system protein A/AmmeMemoRadiSam system protein B|nr:AmmeMemoRadiSam system protein A [Clostridiaceae bacterium]